MPDTVVKPRRKWFRRFVIFVGLSFLGLAALAWFAPTIIAKTSLKDQILASATKDLQGKLTIDDLELSWLSPIEASGVTLTDATGEPVVKIAKFTITKTLWELAQDQTDLGMMTLETPTVYLQTEPGKSNLETLLAKYLESDPNKPKSATLKLDLEVRDGTLELSEVGSDITHKLTGLAVKMQLPGNDEAITVTLEHPATAAQGMLSIDVKVLEKKVDLKVNSQDFALDQLVPIVHRYSRDTTALGRLTTKSQLQFEEGVSFDGTATVTGLSLTGAWMPGDRMTMQNVQFTGQKLVYQAGRVSVPMMDLVCDIGTLSAKGEAALNDAPEAILNQAGVKFHADVDAAKLATMMPKLLRLKPGTELQEGKLQIRLDSTRTADITTWSGTATTSALRATRDGKALAWEKPLKANFTGRMEPGFRPVFDKLECEADFIGLAGRGKFEDCIILANVDLNRLATHLMDFVDLGGARFGGYAEVSLKNELHPAGFISTGTAKITNAQFQDASGRGLTEPLLTFSLNATGKIDPAGPISLATGNLTIQAGADELSAKLLEPINDARSPKTGKLDAKLTGDLNRWRSRVAPWGMISADWQLAGQGPLTGVVTLTDSGVSLTGGRADLVNLRFVGAGVDVNEPKCKLESNATWNRATQLVTLTDCIVHCDTMVLKSAKLDIPSSGNLETRADVTINVNRLQKLLKLQTSPQDADAINGLAIGTANLKLEGSAIGFEADLKVTDAMYGPPTKPSWKEPWVKIRATGQYASDALSLSKVHLERDGLTLDGQGSLKAITGVQDLELRGDMGYELAKLEPQVRELLGAGSRVIGTGSRPFQLTGQLASPQGAILSLGGNAGVNWQQLLAYGFDVGPGELTAKIERGIIKTNPVEAMFGGGKVRVVPTIFLTTPTTEMNFAPGRIVENAKLTPKALSSALGYALPTLAGSTQADGTMSFEMQDNRFPLADPASGMMKGKLTVHTATVSPGPLITEIATLLGAKQVTLTQPKEQTVPIRLEKGRVYHENFTVTIGKTDIRSSGSVGVDGTVSITLDMPVPPKLLQDLVPNNPIIRDALASQRLSVPVGGTLSRPAIDRTAMNASVQTMLRGAIKQGLDKAGMKLGEDLLKKLGKKP